MPHIVVKMVSGRTEEQKRNMTAAIAKAVVEHAGAQMENVTVDIFDVPKDMWDETVKIPEILPRQEFLYKKKGTV